MKELSKSKEQWQRLCTEWNDGNNDEIKEATMLS